MHVVWNDERVNVAAIVKYEIVENSTFHHFLIKCDK